MKRALEKDNLFDYNCVTPTTTIDPTSAFRKKANGLYTISTVKTLRSLLGSLFAKTNKETVKLRFLLSTDHELLFALEGSANSIIPAHYQMTGQDKRLEARCITAGNLKFNKKEEIVEISNKSGDFHPDFNSLQWALAVLIANNIGFAQEIIIEEHKPNNGGCENLSVNSSDLITQINARFEGTMAYYEKINKNMDAIKYTYTIEANNFKVSKELITGGATHSEVTNKNKFADKPQTGSFFSKIKPPVFNDDQPIQPVDPNLKEAVLECAQDFLASKLTLVGNLAELNQAPTVITKDKENKRAKFF